MQWHLSSGSLQRKSKTRQGWTWCILIYCDTYLLYCQYKVQRTNLNAVSTVNSGEDSSYSSVWRCYVGLWCALKCISGPLNIACRSIQTVSIEQSQNWSILCMSRQLRRIHSMWMWTYVRLHHPLHYFPLHSVLHHLCRLCMSKHNKVLWHWLYAPVGSSSITEVCMNRPDIDESGCSAI